MFGSQSCLGLDFPNLVPGSDHGSTLPQAWSRPSPFATEGVSPVQMLGQEGKGAPPGGQVWGGGPAGAAVWPKQLLSRAPPCWAGGRPGEQVAEGKPSGPEQIGLTLPTPPPSSLPRLPPRCQRALEEGAPRLGGRDVPGPGVPPAAEEAPSGPAPDLSPRLTPEPAAAAAGAACGCPCGWAGSGRSGEDASAGGRPRRLRVGWRETAESGREAEPGRGERRESLVTCGPGQGVSQNPSQSSASTTQDGRHVATHIT